MEQVRLPAAGFNIGDHSDVIVAIGVVGILLVMLVPLPTGMLDMMLALNITMSVLVLMLTLYVIKPLDFSVFPSLLLITTLFRLSLNIASTRLILLNGHTGSLAAGRIIKGFGAFVVGGNTTVGLVVFLILVVINFVVITKGAGRIAEVAARFTLDAMPGKQMSIDADLNAGLIDEADARARRSEISREAEFYGAMDGASKFVRGDAIAGILITLINILGGLIIGVIQMGLDVSTAAQNYTILTIGDGLVSQIPAVIISTGAGILVSRAAAEGGLGFEVIKQFGVQPKALVIGAAIILLFGLAPGMPLLPFMILSAGIFMMARAISSAKQKKIAETETNETEKGEEASPEQVEELLPLDTLELEIGYGLIPLVDSQKAGGLLDRIRSLRKQFALDMGVIIPALHIRDNLELKPNEYAICIKGNDIARGELMMDHFLAIDPGDVNQKVEGVQTVEPAFGLPAIWVTNDKKGDAQLSGYTVVDLPSVVTTHLSEIVNQHGYEFLGRQEVQRLLDNLAKNNPKAVEELTPALLSVGVVQKVLQNLLREQVSIRDLLTIVETLADYAPVTKDPELLTEYCRQKLARSLTKRLLEKDHSLKVLSLSSSVENTVLEGINQTEYGAYLALDPGQAERIIGQIKASFEKAAARIEQPIILCSSTIRRHLKKLCERYQMKVAVISHNEVPSGLNVQAVGEIGISQ